MESKEGSGLLGTLAVAAGGAVVREVRERVGTARRDVVHLWHRLSGNSPQVFRTRMSAEPLRQAVPTSESSLESRAARVMEVVSIHPETANAVTIWLRDTEEKPLSFRPGQFLTLLLNIDGTEYRRAYSICSAPEQLPKIAVSCKRVPGGKVSTFLNDSQRFRVGTRVPVLGPSGVFATSGSTGEGRHYVFVAGGSGITPIISMLRSVLRNDPTARSTLLYGNQNREEVMFFAELAALQAKHSDRLSVQHVWKETGGTTDAIEGMLDETVLNSLASRLAGADEYLLCGPEGMRVAVHHWLLSQGISKEIIREERFTSQHTETLAPVQTGGLVQVRAREKLHRAAATEKETVLEAGISAGAPMAFSCTVGGCGACRVKLLEGSVHSEETGCLTEEERKEGYVLACISRPCGTVLVEVPT